MAKIKIGIIGAGNIATAHLQAYAAHKHRCEIVGIADVLLEAAQEKCAQFGGLPFTDAATMLDAVRPDAVSICTPPKFHLPAAQAAAQRGIPVLCEKPPARTLAETETMTAAMRDTLLQFAFCHRFHQPIQQAQTLLRSGQLGTLTQITNRFAFRFPRAGASWFTDPHIAGGGIMIDTLTHSIDIFRALTNSEITATQALLSSALPIPVEDSASLLVRSANGTIGSLTCSWVTPIPQAELRLHGTQGQAHIDYSAPHGLRYKRATDADWTILPFDQPDRFTQQADHFLRCIETDQPPLVGPADGLAVMKVIDAAYHSAGPTLRIAQ